MKRRRFLSHLIKLGVATPFFGFIARALPPRFRRAVKGRVYPGPTLPLRDEDIRKPAKWVG